MKHKYIITIGSALFLTIGVVILLFPEVNVATKNKSFNNDEQIKNFVEAKDKNIANLDNSKIKTVTEADPLTEKEMKQTLNTFSIVFKKQLFPDQIDLNVPAKAKTKEFYNRAKNDFKKLASSTIFNDDDETTRMQLVDYFGIIALGAIKTDFSSEAVDLLEAELSSEFWKECENEDQRRSLFNDKMDIISYVTQINKDHAESYLKLHEGKSYYRYLRDGFENGLYFSQSNL